MTREQWGGRLGFLMATAGFSIGLGTIWRFPYLLGQNGGGAFLAVYLVLAVFIGIPLFTARHVEQAVSPDDAVAAMLKINPKAGNPKTLRISFDATIPLYHTAETEKMRPFQVLMKDVTTTLDMMVQYGGIDPATRGKPEDYYTPEFVQ